MNPTKAEILAGYGRAQRELEAWLAGATGEDLRRQSNGTKWTNEELLFHMVFGYMVVRALLPLARIVSELPAQARAFAAVLNAGTRPFDVVNYWASRAAATIFNHRRPATPAAASAQTRAPAPASWYAPTATAASLIPPPGSGHGRGWSS